MKLPALPPRPNRDNGTILPALLAALLVLMIALQFALPAELDLPSEGKGVVPLKLSPTAVNRVIPDPLILRDALFSPGRSAVAGAKVAGGSGPLDGAVVVGMVRARGVARAIVQQADGSAVSVSVGGRYRGWRLLSITAGNAVFSRDGERLSLAFTTGQLLPSDNGFQPARTNEE